MTEHCYTCKDSIQLRCGAHGAMGPINSRITRMGREESWDGGFSAGHKPLHAP